MKNKSPISPIVLLVCILLISLSLSGCLLVAAGAGAEAGYVATQDDRTASETMKDQAIVASIKTQLIADPEVSAFDINVDSFKGNVTWRGALRTSNEKSRAVELAERTDGVKDVISKLVVVD